MKFTRIIATIPFCFLAGFAHADTRHWNAGLEYLSWQEYIGSCPQTLQERGPRVFVRYDGQKAESGDWDLGWQGKVYGGLVVYDGFTQSCAPLIASTSYFGAGAEASAIRWLAEPLREGQWPRIGIDMGLGVDAWRRSILASGGYSEDYGIGYARLGLVAKRGRTWSAHAGIKQPFASYEVARLGAVGFSSDAALQPKGMLSYFANLEYRFSATSNVTIYYDSYRFNPSDVVIISSCPPANSACSVHQPQSQQDTVGVSWRLNL